MAGVRVEAALGEVDVDVDGAVVLHALRRKGNREGQEVGGKRWQPEGRTGSRGKKAQRWRPEGGTGSRGKKMAAGRKER